MLNTPLAIITGAGRGIGRSIAIGLAEDGYKTILISRTKKELEKVASDIKNIVKSNKELLPAIYPLDITKQKPVQKLILSILKQYGHIDVLINNAGLWIAGSSTLSSKEFDDLLISNLKSAFYFMKEIIPIMKKQKSGYIINISSRAGKIGFIDSGGYSAAKFGLLGLSESLHRELAPEGIKVTSICPGWVDTLMAKQANTPLTPDEMIQPDDIMKTIRWILTLSPAVSIKDILIECRNNIT
jgi:3-oxoacyl-[acyl-carrier protein] reductase